MYICLQPCKEGFMGGCRPILGVDGCHLRGPYPGILLTAVGKDGNNNIFPVAWAVVETENADTWTWFLELLVKDIEPVKDAVTWVHEREEEMDDDNADVTYMSDRQKGLLEAFRIVVPNADTRYCCRYIWANFKLKFPREAYRESFWKAARASTNHHFDKYMADIKDLNPEAFGYLNSIPVIHWSRHGFSSGEKSGMLLNNCCESFNHVLKEAREKPILSLMEWIRRYMMKRCCAKREGLKQFVGLIMPSVLKMIERGQKEVDTHGNPLLACIGMYSKRRLNYEDFVHPAYHVKTYAATYAPHFSPMPGEKQWDKSPLPQPLPPPYRVMPGRPSKRKRKKEAGEAKENKVKRARKQNTCGNCGQLGHNRKKCGRPAAQSVPKQPKGRPRTKTAQHTNTAQSAQQATTNLNQSAPSQNITASSSQTETNRRKSPVQRKAASTSAQPTGGRKTVASKGKQPAPAKHPSKKRKTTSVNALQSSQSSQKSCVSLAKN
ncbi:uncharacterized protein [Spinacia oleracea]|uniref:CCHC-type domain-containing protein n=1 Tax=Spinacia oleracea TaxID=3562 RepID=A0A9R0IHQ0_SPIOL|nr:uncharacterized protein LOC110789209 [Spinacia oleracea]